MNLFIASLTAAWLATTGLAFAQSAQAPAATMTRLAAKLDDTCQIDRERLRKLRPNMLVIQATVASTTLLGDRQHPAQLSPPSDAQIRVTRVLLGRSKPGEILSVANHWRASASLASNRPIRRGQQYLLSIYKYQNQNVVAWSVACP